jgi:penicillin G amidase
MRLLVWLGQIIVCLGLVLCLGQSWGPLPALAPFFSPFEGFWQNAEPLNPQASQSLQISGLQSPIDIVFDSRGIPHIFARTEHDAYLAQGYVTARDRLWQMDIVAREAAGKLAEVFGPDLLDHDLMRQRFGLLQSARQMAATFQQHNGTRDAVQAFCQGANAYLSQLSPKEWPIEFKLLGYAPSPWTPEKMASLIVSMQWTLSSGQKDQALTATLGKYGPLFFQKFFPPNDSLIPPVIPSGTKWPFVEEKRRQDSLQWARQQDSLNPQDSSRLDSLRTLDQPVYGPPLPDSSLLKEKSKPAHNSHGSNNFVLGPGKTTAGVPILGNDPHLDLSLPSIWYEVQLHTPAMNVYGVSLPGSPGVVIGFNDHLSWGLTNGSDDVFDWYRVTFKDSTLSEYLYDSRWIRTRFRVDTLFVRGKPPVLDTVLQTHHGPIVLKQPNREAGRNVPMLHALRWLAHDSNDIVGAFLRLQSSESLEDAKTAVQSLSCPSQNMALAATSGDIALIHQGRFPWKWKTQGRLILDGTDPRHDWQGWVPWNRIPSATNPQRDFVASANQEPTDSTYPYHLGSNYNNPDRAFRLNQRLENTHSASLDTAFTILRDDFGVNASMVLPRLLQGLDTTGFTPPQFQMVQLLQAWDYRYRPDGVAPTAFDAWWKSLIAATWADDFNEDRERYEWPNDKVTRSLILNDSTSDWFDDVRTPTRENLRHVLRASFQTAFSNLRQKLGEDPQGWRWYLYRPVAIRHLLKLPAFSQEKIITGGCPECVDAQRAGHGPAWRMVVEMTSPPTAYGIYPGGQSGNPGSKHYDDFINDWAAGRKYPLLRWKQPPTDEQQIAFRLVLVSQ